jgi:hypothetical protein
VCGAYEGNVVLESGTMDFPDARSSLGSPLAKSLFTVTGVQRVFFGNDFITVTKKPDVEWHEIKVMRASSFSPPPFFASSQSSPHSRSDDTTNDTTHLAGANIRQHYGLLRVGRVGGERAAGYLQYHHPAHGYADTRDTRLLISHIPPSTEQILRPWR